VLLTCENIIKILPIVRFELYNKESCFLIQTNLLNKVLVIFKNHFKYQFKVLTCISGVDYPENLYRFQVVYELLSIKFNSRIRLKILVDELTPLNSIENIFPAASWWECEIWDMFGVFFMNQSNLTRLLTDYGFVGYPLRKDFPLSGFTESRYNVVKNRVIYENLELAQEYRTFEFISPWENFVKNEKIIGKG
jgi:NADH:ubiquinone oxidoreductase subunit C